MRICQLLDNPENRSQPAIAGPLRRLDAVHSAISWDAYTCTGGVGTISAPPPWADVYLLNSPAPAVLTMAQDLERHGALVVNSVAATQVCQDRALVADRLRDAHLPKLPTSSVASLQRLLDSSDLAASLRFPLLIKSRYSRRGDLVAVVRHRAALRVLAAEWGSEPVIVQQFAPGERGDVSLWVIGQEVLAVCRRSLTDDAPTEIVPLAQGSLPAEWVRLALAVGRTFDLCLYRLDLLLTSRGPMIADVDAFPDLGGMPGAECALASLVARLDGARQLSA